MEPSSSAPAALRLSSRSGSTRSAAAGDARRPATAAVQVGGTTRATATPAGARPTVTGGVTTGRKQGARRTRAKPTTEAAAGGVNWLGVAAGALELLRAAQQDPTAAKGGRGTADAAVRGSPSSAEPPSLTKRRVRPIASTSTSSPPGLLRSDTHPLSIAHIGAATAPSAGAHEVHPHNSLRITGLHTRAHMDGAPDAARGWYGNTKLRAQTEIDHLRKQTKLNDRAAASPHEASRAPRSPRSPRGRRRAGGCSVDSLDGDDNSNDVPYGGMHTDDAMAISPGLPEHVMDAGLGAVLDVIDVDGTGLLSQAQVLELLERVLAHHPHQKQVNAALQLLFGGDTSKRSTHVLKRYLRPGQDGSHSLHDIKMTLAQMKRDPDMQPVVHALERGVRVLASRAVGAASLSLSPSSTHDPSTPGTTKHAPHQHREHRTQQHANGGGGGDLGATLIRSGLSALAQAVNGGTPTSSTKGAGTCRKCGARLRMSARFCDQCGQSSPPPAPAPEHTETAEERMQETKALRARKLVNDMTLAQLKQTLRSMGMLDREEDANSMAIEDLKLMAEVALVKQSLTLTHSGSGTADMSFSQPPAPDVAADGATDDSAGTTDSFFSKANATTAASASASVAAVSNTVAVAANDAAAAASTLADKASIAVDAAQAERALRARRIAQNMTLPQLKSTLRGLGMLGHGEEADGLTLGDLQLMAEAAIVKRALEHTPTHARTHAQHTTDDITSPTANNVAVDPVTPLEPSRSEPQQQRQRRAHSSSLTQVELLARDGSNSSKPPMSGLSSLGHSPLTAGDASETATAAAGAVAAAGGAALDQTRQLRAAASSTIEHAAKTVNASTSAAAAATVASMAAGAGGAARATAHASYVGLSSLTMPIPIDTQGRGRGYEQVSDAQADSSRSVDFDADGIGIDAVSRTSGDTLRLSAPSSGGGGRSDDTASSTSNFKRMSIHIAGPGDGRATASTAADNTTADAFGTDEHRANVSSLRVPEEAEDDDTSSTGSADSSASSGSDVEEEEHIHRHSSALAMLRSGDRNRDDNDDDGVGLVTQRIRELPPHMQYKQSLTDAQKGTRDALLQMASKVNSAVVASPDEAAAAAAAAAVVVQNTQREPISQRVLNLTVDTDVAPDDDDDDNDDDDDDDGAGTVDEVAAVSMPTHALPRAAADSATTAVVAAANAVAAAREQATEAARGVQERVVVEQETSVAYAKEAGLTAAAVGVAMASSSGTAQGAVRTANALQALSKKRSAAEILRKATGNDPHYHGLVSIIEQLEAHPDFHQLAAVASGVEDAQVHAEVDADADADADACAGAGAGAPARTDEDSDDVYSDSDSDWTDGVESSHISEEDEDEEDEHGLVESAEDYTQTIVHSLITAMEKPLQAASVNLILFLLIWLVAALLSLYGYWWATEIAGEEALALAQAQAELDLEAGKAGRSSIAQDVAQEQEPAYKPEEDNMSIAELDRQLDSFDEQEEEAGAAAVAGGDHGVLSADDMNMHSMSLNGVWAAGFQTGDTFRSSGTAASAVSREMTLKSVADSNAAVVAAATAAERAKGASPLTPVDTAHAIVRGPDGGVDTEQKSASNVGVDVDASAHTRAVAHPDERPHMYRTSSVPSPHAQHTSTHRGKLMHRQSSPSSLSAHSDHTPDDDGADVRGTSSSSAPVLAGSAAPSPLSPAAARAAAAAAAAARSTSLTHGELHQSNVPAWTIPVASHKRRPRRIKSGSVKSTKRRHGKKKDKDSSRDRDSHDRDSREHAAASAPATAAAASAADAGAAPPKLVKRKSVQVKLKRRSSRSVRPHDGSSRPVVEIVMRRPGSHSQDSIKIVHTPTSPTHSGSQPVLRLAHAHSYASDTATPTRGTILHPHSGHSPAHSQDSSRRHSRQHDAETLPAATVATASPLNTRTATPTTTVSAAAAEMPTSRPVVQQDSTASSSPGPAATHHAQRAHPRSVSRMQTWGPAGGGSERSLPHSHSQTDGLKNIATSPVAAADAAAAAAKARSNHRSKDSEQLMRTRTIKHSRKPSAALGTNVGGGDTAASSSSAVGTGDTTAASSEYHMQPPSPGTSGRRSSDSGAAASPQRHKNKAVAMFTKFKSRRFKIPKPKPRDT